MNLKNDLLDRSSKSTNMKFISLIKRGANLVKLGNAVREFRRAGSEEKKRWAKNYLTEALGASRGIPAKVGQLMTMDSSDSEQRDILNQSIPPLSIEEVEEVLENGWGAPYSQFLSGLEPVGISASLGQVHFARLKDGREVAVKVQYPGIAKSVEAEMDLMGWLPRVGPVSKWGFNLEGYRDVFWENLNEELDYLKEVEQQKTYKELLTPIKEAIVPEVISELCRPGILVQVKEEGFDIEQAEKMVPDQKKAMGRALLKHYLHMIFHCGYVHADPHPGNFAFRKMGRDGFAVIIYDYGSVLKIPTEVRLVLLRMILALRRHENLCPVDCLSAIGFDAEKLADIRSALPALLSVLFEPFLQEAPFLVKDWHLGDRFDRIAGDLKWWFRSAAPPNLIYLMRVLHGLATMLDRLDVPVSWFFFLDQTCGDLYTEAMQIVIPKGKDDSGVRFDGLSRYLKINVVKANGNKVRLTMPARVADDLEDVIEPDVLESIKRQNINLDEIQERVVKSGFVPQEVFQLVDEERDVRVWLE
ncbi:MAG: hypothetical protein COV66_12860 [Nitrospinae bacterium CG11_big_fil_rev_8_21_14_0_20_45_15]|nr:MAG: hypothetical protein COV66_12860 [Nitrospinae bacterium CG11_big_fil_rev_8_21_14_0_20_45_15]